MTVSTITTALVQYSDSGNTRIYSAPGHTSTKPYLVIQKRSVPASPVGSTELSIRVMKATTDNLGAILQARQSAEIITRVPQNGTQVDAAAVLALVREIIASDEFTSAVTTLNWIKA